MKKSDKDFLKLIGKNVRRIRNEKNMSQQELADYANLSKTTIQRIELARMNASVLILRNICLALEVGLGDLVRE